MFKKIFFLINFLKKKQKIHLINLQILIIFSSILETLSIFSIAPFIAIIANNDLINNRNLNIIYVFLNSQDHNDCVIKFGVVLIFVFCFTTFLNIITNWGIIKFSQNLSVYFTSTLYKYYLNKDYIFFTKQNSSDLVSKIILETGRVTGGTIQGFMTLNSKIFLSVFLLFGLVVYEPKITIIASIVIGTSYFILSKYINGMVVSHGINISIQNKNRIKSISEGFLNIKEVIFYKKSNYFYNKFKYSAKSLAHSQIFISAFSIIPIYLFQFFLIGSLIISIIYLSNFDSREFENIIISLSIFALAGLRLIPSINGIYSSATLIKSNLPAFNNLKSDLQNMSKINNLSNISKNSKLSNTKKTIEFKNIFFKFPGSKNFLFNDLNIEILIGKKIGIKGKTGIGKTTLINIILGLINPEKGTLALDNKKYNFKNVSFDNISYVPQFINLLDTSVLENIIFTSSSLKINKAKINKVLIETESKKFVDKMNNNYNSSVGDKGIKLSGGQIQRLGIARALYNNPKILVLDEATSALDSVTETKILSNLDKRIKKSKLTVIFIAHKKSILDKCDMIIDLNKLIS